MGLSSQLAPSAIARPGVIANAAARPASPYEGQAVYQSDTDALLIWNGSAWTPPWNTAWGVVGTPVTITSSQGSIAAVTDITGASITFTAVANRRYKANWQGLMNSTVAGDGFNVFMTDSSNAIQQQCIFYLGTVNDYSFHAEYVFSPGAGSVTRKLRAQRQYGSGTGTLVAGGSYSTQFWIEDIGPA